MMNNSLKTLLAFVF